MTKTVRVTVTFLLGCLLFIAIPIVSWGITDVATFISEPTRLGYLISALVLNAFAAIRIPEVGKTSETPSTTIHHQHWVVTILKVLSLFLVIVSPFCDRRDIAVISNDHTFRLMGLLLYVLGFLTMHFAEAQLGRQFSTEVSIQENHALITNGLYKYLRHPRYLGIIVFSIGISLVFRSWLALLASAATIPVLLWRIRDEEALMHQEFGAHWEAYCKGSWRLVPFIF